MIITRYLIDVDLYIGGETFGVSECYLSNLS